MAKDQNVPNTLKTEGTFKRLPSFKTPRDLNLSQFNSPLSEARTKKVFVPNLNVQRRKQNESGGESSGEPRGGERGGRRGGRGGTRPKREYVQTTGVFSEGLAPSLKAKSSRSSLHESSGSRLSMSSLKDKANKDGKNLAGSGTEDDLVMKELLRDDFIEGGVQPDLDYCPIRLPLTKLEDLKIDPMKEEKLEKLTPDINVNNGIKIKTEPGVKKEVEEPSTETLPPQATDSAAQPTTAQLIAQAHSSDFIFLQIPNSIPRLKVPETIPSKPSASKSSEKDNEDEQEERNTLKSLPAGRVGTLQILRSGRARLVLGDVRLYLEPGTQLPFRQDVMSVEVGENQKEGKMMNLGKISTRMLVTPDWLSLLRQ